MTFLEYFVTHIAPPWLLDSLGAVWMRGLGQGKDQLLYRAKEGVKARLPMLAPRDGLAEVGSERSLGRGQSLAFVAEGDAAYAVRLRQAFDAWYWAGTPYGILRALYVAGYAPLLYICKGYEYSLDTSTGLVFSATNRTITWDFTGRGAAFWSAFILYFPTARWPAAWTTAGAPPAESSAEAQALMTLVKRWKSASSTFARVVIQGTGAAWGLPTSGASGQWGTSRTWSSSGTYWAWTPSQ